MEKQESSVVIIEAIVNPLDPSTAGVKVRIDLSRPNQIAEDFVRALRHHPNVRLTYRAHDPALYRALALGIEKGWSLHQTSRNWVGNDSKVPALSRLRANFFNGLLSATGEADATQD